MKKLCVPIFAATTATCVLLSGCSKDAPTPEPVQAPVTASVSESASVAEAAPAPSTTATSKSDLPPEIQKELDRVIKEGSKPPTGPFDFNQRHFPDSFWDDSVLEPGGYASDFRGKPVYMPKNPNGDKRGDLLPSGDELDCTLPPKITGQQQYVHGREILVSDGYGPTDFSTPYPTGYSKTAASAAVAASNFFTYAWGYADEPAVEFYKRFVKGPYSELVVAKGPVQKQPDLAPLSAAEGVKVEACAGDLVVVDVATPQPGKWAVTRIPMHWDNGMWISKLSKTDSHNANQPAVSSLAGFTRVVLK